MRRLGMAYRIADYVGHSLSKRSRDEGVVFALKLVHFLKELDRLQESNPSFTMTIWAGDGIWICHNGVRLCLVLPKLQSVRLLYERGISNKEFALHKSVMKAIQFGRPIHDMARQTDYWLWRVKGEQLQIILDFVESLPQSARHLDDASHPRHFSGEVRMIALEAFEREGRRCPGVAGRSAPHQVGKNEPIEFDHILPHARGGSRSEINIQVLCASCNRVKRATPL